MQRSIRGHRLIAISRPALALLTAIIVLGEKPVRRGVAVDLVSGTRSKLVAGGRHSWSRARPGQHHTKPPDHYKR